MPCANNCWKKIVLDQLRGYVYNSENPQEEISQDGIFAQDTAEERRSHIADHFFIQPMPGPGR
jgi:hypothetical protein